MVSRQDKEIMIDGLKRLKNLCESYNSIWLGAEGCLDCPIRISCWEILDIENPRVDQYLDLILKDLADELMLGISDEDREAIRKAANLWFGICRKQGTKCEGCPLLEPCSKFDFNEEELPAATSKVLEVLENAKK